MDKKKPEESGGVQEIEASGEAIIIANAIYEGFANLANAIREHTRAITAEEVSEERPPETYLDGGRIE